MDKKTLNKIKEDYFSICNLSAYFLNKKKFWYSKYYNFFHPIKFHPAHTKVYNIFYESKKRETFFSKFIKYTKNSMTELIKLENYTIRNKRYDTCIVSNIISIKKKYSIKDDLYFKGFFENLKNPYVVYRNLTSENSYEIRKKLIDKHAIVVNKKSFFICELYYLAFAIFIFINIKIHILLEVKNNKKKFLKEASKFIHIGNSISNLRICYQILNTINLYQPKSIFITFEGNAWEKILIHHLRKKFKKIQIYGYQFASLNPSHGILNIKLKRHFYPDQILTVGKINYDLLTKSKINSTVKVKIVGTAKYQKPIGLKKFTKTCLILPGENKYEVYKFFELAKKLAIMNDDFNFIFRLHPQRDISYYFKNNIVFPKNLKISKNEIDKDLNSSFFGIYGGSTAILNCLAKGMWPIYYDCSQINVDVIFKLKLQKRSIKTPDDFKRLKNNRVFFKSNFYKIQNFYNNYHYRLNIVV